MPRPDDEPKEVSNREHRDAGAPGRVAGRVPEGQLSRRRYRLRRSLEVFCAADGDVYLLRGGAGTEHAIRKPGRDDRLLLDRLAAGGVPYDARLQPLLDAGAVVPEPDMSALAPGDAERFDRQLPYLEDFGDPAALQRALRASTVAVLGCGGLGTWALGALAGAGIGQFVLIDDDTVELGNLNRQILYAVADVGAPKARRAAAWLHRFDPSIEVVVVERRMRSAGDVAAAAAGADMLLLTADWPPYELARWVDDAARQEGFPYIMAGQQPPVAKIGPTHVPNTGHGACHFCHEARLRREFPLYDELADQRAGEPPAATTLGPASALVGAYLSLEVFHGLLGLPVATRDRVLLVDIQTLQSRWERIERDPDCPRC